MRMWIVSHGGRPFAFIQDYDPLAWDLHHFGDLPPGSRGIDQFIGEPDMLNRGHGSAFIRACSPTAAPQSAPTPTRRTPARSAPTGRPGSRPCAQPWTGKESRRC